MPKPTAVPFDGTPPEFKPGDQVLVKDAWGVWHPKVALGPARYDFPNAFGGKCYLTVPIADPDDWEENGAAAPFVNWSAEDVTKRA